MKGYLHALKHVFSLTGIDLAANKVIGRMFRSFEKFCPPQEIWPLKWNLSLLPLSLTHLPSEPLKLASDKHLTWKTSFLLALTSAKRVSELHGLSFRVWHSRGWRSFTFSFLLDFVAETQNPSVPDPRSDELNVFG